MLGQRQWPCPILPLRVLPLKTPFSRSQWAVRNAVSASLRARHLTTDHAHLRPYRISAHSSAADLTATNTRHPLLPSCSILTCFQPTGPRPLRKHDLGPPSDPYTNRTLSGDPTVSQVISRPLSLSSASHLRLWPVSMWSSEWHFQDGPFGRLADICASAEGAMSTRREREQLRAAAPLERKPLLLPPHPYRA